MLLPYKERHAILLPVTHSNIITWIQSEEILNLESESPRRSLYRVMLLPYKEKHALLLPVTHSNISTWIQSEEILNLESESPRRSL